MRIRLVAILTVAAVWLGACQSSETSNKISKGDVETFLTNYVDATNNLDIAALVEFYSPSDDFYWVEADRNSIYGSRDEIASGLAALTNQFDAVSLNIHDTRITLLPENAAAVTFRFDEAFFSGTDKVFELSGIVSAIIINEQGRLQFITGHTTAIAAPTD